MVKFPKDTSVRLALSLFVFVGLIFSAKLIQGNYPGLLSAVVTSVVVNLTNESREKNNLFALEVSPQLTVAAQLKANDMVEKGYFAHVSPEGISPWHWFYLSGYDFAYAGENLAINFNDSEEVINAWMDSSTHKANILNDKFTQIGVATAVGIYNGREATYVVQMFGKPSTISPTANTLFGPLFSNWK